MIHTIYLDNKYHTILDSVNTQKIPYINSLQAALAQNNNIICYNNKQIPINSWIQDTSNTGYQFSANIPLDNVTSESVIISIDFETEHLMKYLISNKSISGEGYITIFSVKKPTSIITIPQIIIHNPNMVLNIEEITFTIGYSGSASYRTFIAQKGMTWDDFITSGYNSTSVIYANGDSVYWDYYETPMEIGHIYDVIESKNYIGQECCFIAGTQITTSLDGQTKNIEDLKPGDMVVSYDVDSNSNYLTRIKSIQTNPASIGMAKIDFSNGASLEMTDYHPLYTDKGWASLTDTKYLPLKIGDKIKSINDWVLITDVKLYCLEKPITTYTLDVRDENEVLFDNEINDNYYANGIVAHNATAACK